MAEILTASDAVLRRGDLQSRIQDGMMSLRPWADGSGDLLTLTPVARECAPGTPVPIEAGYEFIYEQDGVRDQVLAFKHDRILPALAGIEFPSIKHLRWFPKSAIVNNAGGYWRPDKRYTVNALSRLVWHEQTDLSGEPETYQPSWAVGALMGYDDTKANNWRDPRDLTGQSDRNYTTGKWGCILPPFCALWRFDAFGIRRLVKTIRGKWVWIDPVTLAPEYPFAEISPYLDATDLEASVDAILGYTGDGSALDTYKLKTDGPYTASADGSIDSYHWRGYENSLELNYHFATYANDSGVPGPFVANSSTGYLTLGAQTNPISWYSHDCSAPKASVVNGNTYHLALFTKTTTSYAPVVTFDALAGAGRIAHTQYDTPPDPMSTVYLVNRRYSIYTNHTAAGPYQGSPPAPHIVPEGYQLLGKWRIKSLKHKGALVTFQLEELKRLAGAKAPSKTFTREDYPNAEESLWGTAMPLIYGRVFRVKAFCVDEGAKRFVVAGHELHRLVAVYSDGALAAVTSVILADAAFTYPDWDGMTEITVDCEGKETIGGDLMANPSDVLADLIAVEGGEGAAALDATSFSDARAAWKIGTLSGSGEEVHAPAVGLYADTATDIVDLCGQVLKACFGLLYVGHEGTFRLRAWAPLPAADLPRLHPEDFAAPPLPEVKHASLVTRVLARYQENHATDECQTAELESEAARLQHGLSTHLLLETDPPLAVYERRDAERWCGAILAMRSRPTRFWTLEANRAALLLEPGDQVWIHATDKDERGRTFDTMRGVFDVIGVSKDPLAGKVQLLVSDRRGLGDTPGFMMAGTETFPAHLGGGAMDPWDPDWTAEQKEWALGNGGYFMDTHDEIDDGDRSTHGKSRAW